MFCFFKSLSFLLLYVLMQACVLHQGLHYTTSCAAINLSSKYEHVTPLLINLHWLPLQERSKFQILIITFKALHRQASPYICNLLKPYCPARTPCSSNQNLLYKPVFNLKTYGGYSFSIAALTFWNIYCQPL